MVPRKNCSFRLHLAATAEFTKMVVRVEATPEEGRLVREQPAVQAAILLPDLE